MFGVAAYLDRISYTGPTAPTLEILRAIHRAHMLSVPFENLDIALGRKIVIDEDAFLRKVVEHRRGGFCYELNGALAALLRALGFRVTLLSARVARDSRDSGREDEWGPEFDHLTLQVDLGAPWLADVGFGDSFLEPLRMGVEREQTDRAGRFRLLPSGNRLQLEKAAADESWKRQYSFSLQPRRLEEFAGICHYHQTSPESPFTQTKICSRATPEGRITLADTKLIVTKNGIREERILSPDQREQELRESFGVIL